MLKWEQNLTSENFWNEKSNTGYCLFFFFNIEDCAVSQSLISILKNVQLNIYIAILHFLKVFW